MAFNFEQLKGLFSTIKDKGAAVAGVAADKTKDAARIARLTMDINTEKSGLEKAFLDFAASRDALVPAEGEWEATAYYLMPQVRALVGRYSKLGDDAFYHLYLDIDDMVAVATAL